MVFAALGLAVGSPTVMIAGPVAVIIAVHEWRRRRAGAVERQAADRLPVAVDHLIQQLRAGRSLRQSCEGLGEAQLIGELPALAPLSSRLRAGGSLMEAAALLDGESDHAVQLLSTTLQVLVSNGGPAVPALQRLRHTLILATQSRQQADAEAGQAMASAGLLVAAPAIFAVAVGALDRAVARLYLYEAAGVACVLAALLLSFFGWSWMQRLMAVALKSAQ